MICRQRLSQPMRDELGEASCAPVPAERRDWSTPTQQNPLTGSITIVLELYSFCIYLPRKFSNDIHALVEHYLYKITLVSLIQVQIYSALSRMRDGARNGGSQLSAVAPPIASLMMDAAGDGCALYSAAHR